MRRYGIRQSLQLLTLGQLPFILWFFWTLQEIVYEPEKFPGIETDGFMWFKNLADPDPYFVLSFLLAGSTFLNIHKSPASAANIGQAGKYMKYVKYFSFFAIPVTSTFPSAMVLNWFMMSFLQLGVSQLTYTQWGRRLLRLPKYLPGTLMEKHAAKVATKVVKPIVTKFKK
jgi:membrane protein insertase Oxa1/YidC/SpoIIIJ